jgi:hypothetical protein
MLFLSWGVHMAFVPLISSSENLALFTINLGQRKFIIFDRLENSGHGRKVLYH